MAEVLARVELGSFFRNLRGRLEDLRDNVLIEGGEILRREEEASINLRWHDEGKTLRSLQEDVVRSGDSITYRLFPTATSEKGAPYPLFGEYGTGRRGARTGRPAPRGYKYGTEREGMEARRFSRIAVMNAQPLITAKAKQLIANFTVN